MTQEITDTLTTPETSAWLRTALKTALTRDPIEAATDATRLADLLCNRVETLLFLDEWSSPADTGSQRSRPDLQPDCPATTQQPAASLTRRRTAESIRRSELFAAFVVLLTGPSGAPVRPMARRPNASSYPTNLRASGMPPSTS